MIADWCPRIYRAEFSSSSSSGSVLSLGWVVQRMGRAKNESSIFFSKKNVTVLKKYLSGFSREKLVNPKITV